MEVMPVNVEELPPPPLKVMQQQREKEDTK